jgi:hypothetical protein
MLLLKNYFKSNSTARSGSARDGATHAKGPEGQDVEVTEPEYGRRFKFKPYRWGKIVERCGRKSMSNQCDAYAVRFPNGWRAVFDADHIRPSDSLDPQMDKAYDSRPHVFN